MRSGIRAMAALVLVAAGGLPAATPALAAHMAVIPAEIDLGAKELPAAGVPVGHGQVRDTAGRPTSAGVAVLAWPTPAVLSTLSIGDVVRPKTLGWTVADASGRFTLRLDRRRVGHDYVNPDGAVNVEVIAWAAAGTSRWGFPAHLDGTSPADLSLTVGSGNTPLRTTSTTTDMPSVSTHVKTYSGSFYCGWALRATSYPDVVIGETWPYGQDTGWMSSSTSHSVTLGWASSGSGTYGSWSLAGTTTSTLGVTFTWDPSIYYRDYRVTHKYGKYQSVCGNYPVNNWEDRDSGAAGGYTNTYLSAYPSWTHCQPFAAGTWTRDDSTGSAYTLSAGVKISPYLGIDLSMSTQYATSRSLSYHKTVAGHVCGDNNDPRWASRVESAR